MKRGLLAFAAAGLLAVSACASSASTASEPTASEDTTVLLPKSYKFAPEVVEVAVGGTVTWINQDDFPHTVQLLDGSEGDKPLGVGETTSITFEKAGSFPYNCSLHPTQMKGEVVVRDSSS